MPKLGFKQSYLSMAVLAILCKKGSAHGYKITKLIAKLSHGRFLVKPETISPILKGFEKDKLALSKKEKSPAGPPRTVYQPTEKGLLAYQEMCRHVLVLAELIVPGQFRVLPKEPHES